ncbi:MAG: hypothetical protein ACRDZZ_06660 [Ilumatobacteraceae bacterium]
MKKPATVRFTEEMKGALGFGADGHREGWAQGNASGTEFMFHLTISVSDVDRFADDPDHTAPAVGWVRCRALSEADMLVERGVFNLFAPGFADGRLTMRYRLWFRDGAGQPLTMSGYKDVGDDPGLDVWKDTTSLAVDLLTGHVEEAPRAADGRPQPEDPALIRARGIIVIRPLDFARQLTTFRGTVSGVARFAGMFMAALWRTYRGRGSGQGGSP